MSGNGVTETGTAEGKPCSPCREYYCQRRSGAALDVRLIFVFQLCETGILYLSTSNMSLVRLLYLFWRYVHSRTSRYIRERASSLLEDYRKTCVYLQCVRSLRIVVERNPYC